ncbi:MAG: hypothetical protein M1817_000066 [Caeruleum heppii]|nr:MAG: hypothetical protein M1817_000066 [Caeruleum heppii]
MCPPNSGASSDFGICDSSGSLSIIKRIIKGHKLDVDPAITRGRISSLKARGIGADGYSGPSKSKKFCTKDCTAVYQEYEAILLRSNLLDYDDLLLRCVDLLRAYPACVSNVEAVLIDEYQDTNLVQFDLMKLLAVRNNRVCTVGDPDQSIYSFRFAEVENLKRMQKHYPDAVVVHLTENYRSSAAILLAALAVIEQDRARPVKPMLPTHCIGTQPVLRQLSSATDEARWIVSEIKRSLAMTGGQLLSLNDYAVLLRSAALSRHLETALAREGLPYKVQGGSKFYERLEIRLLLDYLRVVDSPSDSEALARIINVPPRRIGGSTIQSLLEDAEAKGVTLFDRIRRALQDGSIKKTKLTKSVDTALGSLIGLILKARGMLLKERDAPFTVADLITHLSGRLNLEDYLRKSYAVDYESRWANVQELLIQASDFSAITRDEVEQQEALPLIDGLEQSTGAPAAVALSRFLSNITLSSSVPANPGEQEAPQITISTIHAAKGLEWPVIFIPAVSEGTIPHSRAEDTDEERRLLYVAMTRAQCLLYLSTTATNSQKDPTQPSRFVAHKGVGPHLDDKGPSFTQDMASSFARILKRPCPSGKEISHSATSLPSTEDDLWTVDGQEVRDRDALGAESMMLGRFRNRYDFDGSAKLLHSPDPSEAAGGGRIYTTTVQAVANRSAAEPRLTVGFVSARSHYHHTTSQHQIVGPSSSAHPRKRKQQIDWGWINGS